MEVKIATLEKDNETNKKASEQSDSLVKSLKEKLEITEKELVANLESTKLEKDTLEKLKDAAEAKFEDFRKTNSEKIEKIAAFEDATNTAAKDAESMRSEVETMKTAVEEAEKAKTEEIQKAGTALAEKLAAEMEQWRLDEEVSHENVIS